MFVRNYTRHEVTLAKGRILDDLAVGAILHRAVFRIEAGRLVRWEGARSPLPDDPPETHDRPLWHGTSVTLSGQIRGPGRIPRPVRLDVHVADRTHGLLVWGDRRWVRNAGKLIPSTPSPWEAQPLRWSAAFGGSYDVPPGPHPVSKLPQPGGCAMHPLNPHGVGLYPDERAAEGQPLPNIEWPDRPIAAWSDTPRPAGASPCPDLMGLRLPAERFALEDPAESLRLALRVAHHAPGELVFDWLSPDTPLAVRGATDRALELSIPHSPLDVRRRRGQSSDDTRPRVRSVHVSLDDGAVLIDYSHSFLYEPAQAPAWLTVNGRA